VNVLDDEWGDQPEGWSGGGGRSKRLVERGPLVGASVHEPDPGNHGVRNDSDEAVRYVVADIRVSPEVLEYPDLKQITAQVRTDSQTGERLWLIHDVPT
jgi:uncharacterized cupin superfamily protein